MSEYFKGRKCRDGGSKEGQSIGKSALKAGARALVRWDMALSVGNSLLVFASDLKRLDQLFHCLNLFVGWTPKSSPRTNSLCGALSSSLLPRLPESVEMHCCRKRVLHHPTDSGEYRPNSLKVAMQWRRSANSSITKIKISSHHIQENEDSNSNQRCLGFSVKGNQNNTLFIYLWYLSSGLHLIFKYFFAFTRSMGM